MAAVRVPWSSASFLVYLGGLTILFATVTLLNFQAEDHGTAGLVVWSLLITTTLSTLAFAAKARSHFVTAGLLATSWVASVVVFLGAVLDWVGWLPDISESGVFEGFRFWLLVLELVAVVASVVALQTFRFPLLVLLVAATTWFFVTDLLSGGGDWTAIVTIVVGLTFLLAGIAVDDGPSRTYGFWLHVAAGLTIGGGLLWFFHDSTFDWILIGVVGLAYVGLATRLARSSWAVLGAWGMLQTAGYFADKWSDVTESIFPLFYFFPFFISLDGNYSEHAHNWLGPLVFAVTGAVFIGIGIVLAPRTQPPIAEI
jgi:hypothetical protein